jgi:hypothetical protein
VCALLCVSAFLFLSSLSLFFSCLFSYHICCGLLSSPVFSMRFAGWGGAGMGRYLTLVITDDSSRCRCFFFFLSVAAVLMALTTGASYECVCVCLRFMYHVEGDEGAVLPYGLHTHQPDGCSFFFLTLLSLCDFDELPVRCIVQSRAGMNCSRYRCAHIHTNTGRYE